jgi:hypothetical protein
MGEGLAEGDLEGERAGGAGGGGCEAAGLEAALDSEVAVGVITREGAGRVVCNGSAGSSIVPSPNNISMTPAPCWLCSAVNVEVFSIAAVASAVTTGKPH